MSQEIADNIRQKGHMGRNWNKYILYLAGSLFAATAAYGNGYWFLLDTTNQFLIFFIIIMLLECIRPDNL